MTAGRKVNTASRDWGTPEKYVRALSEFFLGQPNLDPCSNGYSIVPALMRYMLPDHDGLRESWDYPAIYVNPPYGADKGRGTSIKDWLERCCRAHRDHDSTVLALIPVATNTRHWKEHVFGQATGVCFLYDTRLKFLVEGKETGKGAPMACAMVYWGNDYDRFMAVFRKFGAVVDLRPLREQGHDD